MDDVNNSVNPEDDNLNLDISKMLKKERDNFIKQKNENDISLTVIRKMINELESKKQTLENRESELNLLHNQLKSDYENEIITKNNFQNYVMKLKEAVEVFDLQLKSLKHNIETNENNTENLRETHSQIINKLEECAAEQTKKYKAYEEEIYKLELIIKAKEKSNYDILETKKLCLKKKQEELKAASKEEENLKTKNEEGDAIVSQLNAEFVMKQKDIENCGKEISHINMQIKKFQTTYNLTKSNYEEKKISLIEKSNQNTEKNQKIQIELECLKQEHDKLVTSISQIQIDLKTLEVEQNNIEDQNESLTNEINNLKIDITNISTEEEDIQTAESAIKEMLNTFENLKSLKTKVQDKINSNKDNTSRIKQELLEKSDQKKELLKKCEDKEQTIADQSLRYEGAIIEYNNKIKDSQSRNELKKTEIEELQNAVDSKLAINKQIEEQIHQINERTNTILYKKKIELKSVEEELEEIKNDRKSKELEWQDIVATINENIKQTKKIFNNDSNNIDIKIIQFKNEIDTELKNYRNMCLIERKKLEDSSKLLLRQINDLKQSKEKFQLELKDKLTNMLNIANKIEVKKLESAKIFKSPILPKAKRSKPETITTTPKIESKNIEIRENKKRSGSVLKQEPDNLIRKAPKLKIWPTDIETSDDGANTKNIETKKAQYLDSTETKMADLSDKKINLNSFNNEITDSEFEFSTRETSEVDTFGLPQKNNITHPSHTQKADTKKLSESQKVKCKTFQPKKKEFSSQIYHSKKANLWLSDESDNADENLKPTQKLQTIENDNLDKLFDSLKSQSVAASSKIESMPSQTWKKPIIDFGDDSSDDNFFRKLSKSSKAQENLRSLSKSSSIVNLDTSSD